MQVRFNTDRDLFETFPNANEHVKTPPADVHPLVFIKTLMTADKIEDAISFCAYLLPRREAVAWGCRVLRNTDETAGNKPDERALRAAELWVEAPSEHRRLAAYERWQQGDRENAAVWLALGAAWSGGSLQPDMPNSIPAGPDFSAKMVRIALLLTLHKLPRPRKPAAARDWMAAGVHLAQTGL